MINRTYYSKDHQGTSAYHVFAAQLVGFKNMSIFTVKQDKALDVVFTKTLGDKSVNLDFASEVNLEMLVFHPPEAQSNRENHLWVIKSFYIRLSILLNYLNLLWLVYFTKFPPPAPRPHCTDFRFLWRIGVGIINVWGYMEILPILVSVVRKVTLQTKMFAGRRWRCYVKFV